MNKKSRKEKSEVTENANWGSYGLILIVVFIGALAYNYEAIGDKWTKVLEIVGGPFSLGLGFFAYEKAYEKLNEYQNKDKEENK